MIRLYLLLGGNIGDKQKVFSETRDRLRNLLGKITAQSAVFETEPWGFESPDIFWNQALEISTSLSPEEVLAQTQIIEQKLGRIRKESQYSSRIIDIDILFYGDQIIHQENLVIPHPRIQERKFALVPLFEIAPELVHPVFQKSIGQMLEKCTDELMVKIVPDVMR
ncbi:MAG TPA: 2-amino-4-hydroxy-6-hydroxymethyldihydropteridine diphosphokinase [Prolixibacteraceae bacterium]|nr:2-amino-4-hydroxy-6-hydroxymethyldihydropteridine diphosphokinase [Prolixibacteraceae bacterium]